MCTGEGAWRMEQCAVSGGEHRSSTNSFFKLPAVFRTPAVSLVLPFLCVSSGVDCWKLLPRPGALMAQLSPPGEGKSGFDSPMRWMFSSLSLILTDQKYVNLQEGG